MKNVFTLGLFVTSLALTACSESPQGDSTAGTKPAAPSIPPELAEAQQLWSKNCQVCHLNGLGGAPVVGDKKAWASRIAKGESTLIENAVKGFTGEEGIMPPKGGATQLSDQQIADIVKFMVHVSQ